MQFASFSLQAKSERVQLPSDLNTQLRVASGARQSQLAS